MATPVLEPIPWTYTETPSLVMWTWHTPHFLAKISSVEAQGVEQATGRAVKAYQWEIGDLVRPNQGMPRFLMEGMCADFRTAEMAIRENIGKSYASSYGYAKFSGALAKTFTIATGERLDFSKFENTDCLVDTLMPDGTERRISGVLTVHHYKIRVLSDRRVLEVRPEHIKAVSNASRYLQRANALRGEDTYTGIGRIYQSEWRPGCTGAPGFMQGTVDHAGALLCPLHEST